VVLAIEAVSEASADEDVDEPSPEASGEVPDDESAKSVADGLIDPAAEIVCITISP